MQAELTVVVLFSVATAVALVARRFDLPYTVALVVAGLGLGAVGGLTPPRLTKELLYAVFFPGLLFEAAFALEFSKFWANKVAIGALAFPGLLAAMALTVLLLVPAASGLHFVEGFGLAHGLVFAAVTAATDPIAVVALFRRLGAPKRLAVLIEGESLLNDGTAVVVFTIVLGSLTGQPVSATSASLDFVVVVGMGLLVGGLVGLAASLVIQRVDDPMIEITLTTIAAYGSFVVAEQFHASGVIATVTAGLLCGSYAARTGMSPTTRVAVASFWEYLAFALNSLVFLLIGLEVHLGGLLSAWKPIVLAFLAMTLARAAVVGLVGGLLRRSREAFPLRWAPVLTWGGLRGGLSMVLVLGLPRDMEHRELLVSMTFGVVILSILLQGLTMGSLLRRLGLAGQTGHAEYERLKAAQRASTTGLEELERLTASGQVTAEVADELRASLSPRAEALRGRLRDLQVGQEALQAEERRAALRQVLAAEKDALQASRRAGQLSQESYEALVAEVDAMLLEQS